MKLSLTKPEKEAGFWHGRTSPKNSTAFQHQNVESLSLSVLTKTPEVTHLSIVLCIYKVRQMTAA